MKKIVLSTFLVVILTIISVVPAFAATYRIGSTSWYYSTEQGFGGGDRGDGTVSVSYSTLVSYKNSVMSAYPSYTYAITTTFPQRISVSSNGSRIGYLCNSSGNVYAYHDSGSSGSGSGSSGDTYNSYYFDNGALYSTDGDSGIEYSVAAWVRHVFNRLGTISDRLSGWLTSVDNDSGKTYTVADWTRHVFNRLGTLDEHFSSWFTSVDNDSGKTYSVADWTRHVYNRIGTVNSNLGGKLDNVYSRLNTTNGYIDGLEGYVDGLEGKLDTVNSNLSSIKGRLLKTDANGAQYTVADLLYNISTRLLSTNGYIDGLEGKLDGLEDVIKNYSGDRSDIVVPITDLDNNLNLKFDSLIDAVLNTEAQFSTGSNDPFTRKIYNVLYNGVDGTGADMVDVATSQIGVAEGSPYYKWYGFDSHVNWCACFVSWCADRCGYLDNAVPRFCLVEDAIDWYRARGLWQNGGYTPSPGDIIFFDWENDRSSDHVGIVADCSNGIVTTVEGNKGDSPGVVGSRSISVNSSMIYGYGTPDYPTGGSSIYSVLNTYLSDFSRKYDTVIDLLTTNHYFTGYATDLSGAAFPTQSIPYDSAVQIVSKFNSEMIGKKVTVLKRDGSGTIDAIVSRAAIQQTGRITVYTTLGNNYWLCDNRNTIFIADAKTDYSSSIADIYTRLGTIDTNLGGKLDTANTRLSTLNSSVTSGFSGIGGKLDTVIDLLTTNHYFTGYATDVTGAAFPTQSIPYDSAVQIVSKFNSEMIGKKVTVLKRDGSGTIDATVSRAAIQQTGRITVYTTGGNNYWLCDNRNTIFIADAKTDYSSSITSIYSRMSDLISAVNNLSVGVDLSDVSLSVDASSINVDTYNVYCCSYLTDSAGSPYSAYTIPYDTAVDMVARLNTECVGDKFTLLRRTGGASTGYIRSASILSDGYIQVRSNSGSSFYLCDNANVLFKVDSSSNYGDRIDNSINAGASSITMKLTDIENALSNLGDDVSITIEQVSNVDIDIENSAHDVFYVTDDDGDKSIVDLSGDSIKVVGKLMNFLYQAMFKDALNDADSGIDGLYDFYLDDSEGVDVWDS